MVMDDMRSGGQAVEVQTYNLMIVTCTKMGHPFSAINMYKRYVHAGGVGCKAFPAPLRSCVSTTVSGFDDLHDKLPQTCNNSEN